MQRVVIDFNETPFDDCGAVAPLCGGHNWTWPSDPPRWMSGTRTFMDPLPASAQVVRVEVRARAIVATRLNIRLRQTVLTSGLSIRNKRPRPRWV